MNKFDDAMVGRRRRSLRPEPVVRPLGMPPKLQHPDPEERYPHGNDFSNYLTGDEIAEQLDEFASEPEFVRHFRVQHFAFRDANGKSQRTIWATYDPLGFAARAQLTDPAANLVRVGPGHIGEFSSQPAMMEEITRRLFLLDHPHQRRDQNAVYHWVFTDFSVGTDDLWWLLDQFGSATPFEIARNRARFTFPNWNTEFGFPFAKDVRKKFGLKPFKSPPGARTFRTAVEAMYELDRPTSLRRGDYISSVVVLHDIMLPYGPVAFVNDEHRKLFDVLTKVLAAEGAWFATASSDGFPIDPAADQRSVARFEPIEPTLQAMRVSGDRWPLPFMGDRLAAWLTRFSKRHNKPVPVIVGLDPRVFDVRNVKAQTDESRRATAALLEALQACERFTDRLAYVGAAGHAAVGAVRTGRLWPDFGKPQSKAVQSPAIDEIEICHESLFFYQLGAIVLRAITTGIQEGWIGDDPGNVEILAGLDQALANVEATYPGGDVAAVPVGELEEGVIRMMEIVDHYAMGLGREGLEAAALHLD